MDKVVDIIQALFLFFVAWWGFSYYTGRIKYSDEQEKRRQERVDKYGGLLIIGIAILLISGLCLIIMAVS